MTSPRIILYSWDRCPWAHRSRIAAKAAGINLELVTVNPGDKPPWYIPNVNPAGKVPSLWYDAPKDADPTKPPAGTTILPESGIHVDFILSLAPGKVTYGNPVSDAWSYAAAQRFEERVLSAWGKLSRSSEGNAEDVEAFLTPLRQWVKEFLEVRGGELVSEKGYGKGDILIAPFVNRIFDLSQADAGAWNEGTGPAIYKRLTTDPELAEFQKLYKKLKNWSAFQGTHDNDELIRATKETFGKLREKRLAGGA